MNDEIWEFTPTETKRIMSVLSFLRDCGCPYIGRPVVRVYEEESQKNIDTRCTTESPRRIILSYPSPVRKLTLHQYLQLEESRRYEVKVGLAYQLVQAVAYLHKCGVSHQFLSSDAVAVELGPEPIIKITNFYSCTTSFSNYSGSYICVRKYRPPEVVLQLSGIKPNAVDCWALGCLLFEVYTGTAAFSLERGEGTFRPQLIKQQLEEAVKGIGRLDKDDIPPGCPERVSQYLLSLDCESSIFSRLQLAGPEEEAKLWISLVMPFLKFNYLLRAEADELLQHKVFAGLPPPVNWHIPTEVASELEDLLD
ncbi:protein kinase [Trypanosoma theileri]|uniref:Protein kinase n=1 Tax=Trypanosoma theileri TaxID=67003 RepID=A0A1X0P5Q1_9TRYP|nr:protein kinase [Trypanosoma theileri]ORC92257.1 protein kinase [Trypanosoma theileri]